MDIDTYQVHGVVVTGNDVHDSTSGELAIDLVDQPIEDVRGDGAYDTVGMRGKIKEKGAIPIIPPREDAVAHPDKDALIERNAALSIIEEGMKNGQTQEEARRDWKEGSGYFQRSNIETQMYRLKTTFGDKLQSRKFEKQVTEVFLKTAVLNRNAGLGIPKNLKNA